MSKVKVKEPGSADSLAREKRRAAGLQLRSPLRSVRIPNFAREHYDSPELTLRTKAVHGVIEKYFLVATVFDGAMDGAAILDALSLCFVKSVPIPDWVAQEYLKKHWKFRSFDTASLDQAFGIKPINDREREMFRSRLEMVPRVVAAMNEAADAAPALSESKLLERVAEELNISRAMAREMYREGQLQWNKRPATVHQARRPLGSKSTKRSIANLSEADSLKAVGAAWATRPDVNPSSGTSRTRRKR